MPSFLRIVAPPRRIPGITKFAATSTKTAFSARCLALAAHPADTAGPAFPAPRAHLCNEKPRTNA
jgi:hypothetical protein